MHELVIAVDGSGNSVVVFHPNDEQATQVLEQVPGVVVEDRRAGYVLPQAALERLAFRLLRRMFDGGGRVAAWTRTWSGPWMVVSALTGYSVGQGFATHAEAVAYEVTLSLRGAI